MRWNHADSQFIGWLVVLPLICPWAMSAHANPASLEELLHLELEELLDVRVGIASHFIEPQLTAGSTVSAVTEEQWRQRGARRLYEAIGHLPGIVVLPNLVGAEQPIVRGYADTNNRSGVATLWDGVPFPSALASAQTTRPNINLGTLDRIEMIRGPGSALHGENAFHGVLALHAFESVADVTRVTNDVATNGYYHAGVKHSQPAGDDARVHVSAAFSGQPDQHRSYTFYEPPGTSERAFEYQSTTAVVKLTSDPKQKLTWNAGLYWDDNDARGFLGAGTSGAAGLDHRDQGGADSQFKIARAGLGYQINATTASEAMVYYTNQNATLSRYLTTTRQGINKHDENDAGAQFVIHQQALLGNTNWSAALGLRRQRIGDATVMVTADDAVISNSTEPFSDFARDISSLSIDADSAFVGDTVHLRYGARVDSYSDVGTHTTPRLGVIVQPNPSDALKLLYGEGFRAPNALEVKGSNFLVESNPGIKPEEIKTLELAYLRKTERTLTELVLFKSRWEESIVIVPSTAPGFIFQFDNSGESEAYGAEASYTRHAGLWTVETSGSYVRSENATLNRDYNAFPRWILNAGVGYRLARYDTEIFVNERVHLDADEGQITDEFSDPEALKDYWRTDVHIATRLTKNAAVTYDIRNLFDRQNALPSIQPNPSPDGIPEEGRSVKLGVRYSF